MSEEYAIRIKNVSKMYKLYARNRDRVYDAFGFSKHAHCTPHYALSHVNFDVKKGECVGIIGTNGAGKSTILKIITGVLSPTEGSLEVDGRISALLELGAGFNQEYTGMENVYLNGTMMGYSKEEIDEKLPSILEFADIGDYIDQPVKMYSSGMFVRLAFAVAINIDPEILVVDEALSVGDVFFQSKCYQKFEDFKREKKTILFVSHDLNSIAKYCDRVILLNKGEKLSEGTPKEMIDLYKKILAGTDIESEQLQNDSADTNYSDKYSVWFEANKKERWKNHFRINPNVDEYGNKKAVIRDFAILDENGRLTSTLIKGSAFTIKYRVCFFEDVENPIFTFTFKTVRGVDVTGTNTLIEHTDVPHAKKGEEYEITFQQVMNMQGGEYLLSMSCTTYEYGELRSIHRCYDLISVSVVSDKDTVGFYDMDSEVSVESVRLTENR